MQVEETQESKTPSLETKTEVTTPPTQVTQAAPLQEQQMAELSKVAKMQHKVLSGLIRAHLGSYLNQLAFAPKVSGNEKADLIVKLLDGIEGVLDLGLDVTGTKVPEKGSVGKNVATMMGILAQALDNRMLLLAHNMDAAEKANSIGANVEVNKLNETQGE